MIVKIPLHLCTASYTGSTSSHSRILTAAYGQPQFTLYGKPQQWEV